MTSPNEMESVIEAILFVANDPVPRDKLFEVFGEADRPAAEEALAAVATRYREGTGRGIVLDEVAGGMRLVSRPDLHGYLRRFFEVSGTNKLTMAALETLAIVAYRQPITGPEIQELRGVNSSGVLKKLLERRLVRIAGRKEVVGKPFLYTTTRDFLMHFGLRSLKELPPLEQFEELLGSELDEPGDAGPDLEEEASQEAARLDEEEQEASEAEEAATIAAERAEAELLDAVDGVGEDEEAERSAEDSTTDPANADGESDEDVDVEAEDEAEAEEQAEVEDQGEDAESEGPDDDESVDEEGERDG